MTRSLSSNGLTRREALELLTLAAGAVGAWPSTASAQGPTFPRGAIIRTLFKDMAPEELAGGATSFHEHLSLPADFNAKFSAATAAARAANGLPAATAPAGGGGGRQAGAPPAAPPAAGAAAPGGAARGGGPPAAPGPDPMRDVNLMVQELLNAKRDGLACIVDAGAEAMGRDLEFIKQASMKADLPVIAAGGFYTQPFYPKEISTMSEEQIVRALIKQADETPLGAFGEIGSWDEMTPDERKVFRAVGKAHLATNLPIFTHTGIPGKAAIEQLNLLEDAGVNPSRVLIGHLGNLVDPNVYVHRAICRRGAYVGFDRQGGGNDAQQVPLVMALIEAGFTDNIMIAGDASRGYGRPLTNFVPRLKAAGATDEVLHKITADNPRRFLAFVPKRSRKR
jgi:phosphotriesterase-related protein